MEGERLSCGTLGFGYTVADNVSDVWDKSVGVEHSFLMATNGPEKF